MKQSCPHAGRFVSPGIAVPTLDDKELEVDVVPRDDEVLKLVVEEDVPPADDDVLETELEVELRLEDEVEAEVDDDDVVELDIDEVVTVNCEEVELSETLVVIPSKACAQTAVPSGPAVMGTTVSPPVRSKDVTSISAPPPIYEEQAAEAPGRLGSSKLGASKL